MLCGVCDYDVYKRYECIYLASICSYVKFRVIYSNVLILVAICIICAYVLIG